MHSGSSTTPQAQSAQRMYSQRATDYEKSWHPEYSKRFMEIADIKTGDRVLDLACGTGLDAVIAARGVGDEGIVIGVDVTPNMLVEARKKQNADPVLHRRLKLVQHDIANLTNCESVEKGAFDWILCSSAFVLLEHSEKVVAHWREYLRQGGKMVIDITHENNLRSGVLLERVAKRMGIPFPSNRTWIKSIDSFREILESKGFVVERIESLERIVGEGTSYLGLDQADDQFDSMLNGPLGGVKGMEELRNKGRAYFKEEWDKAAVDGKAEFSDIVYVYVARKV
ncbi:Fc.00g102100.m01.CDS01 [Cosmosporella sp. VM-42]